MPEFDDTHNRFIAPPPLSIEGYEVEIGDLMISSNTDQIAFNGCLALKADRRSIKRAETLTALLQAFLAQVKAMPDLPEVAANPPVTLTVAQPNPFQD